VSEIIWQKAASPSHTKLCTVTLQLCLHPHVPLSRSKMSVSDTVIFLPRDDANLASAVYACVCPSVRPSVRHMPVLYRNDWTNRAGFWQPGFFPPISHCAIRKFRYRGLFQSKNGTYLCNFVPIKLWIYKLTCIGPRAVRLR